MMMVLEPADYLTEGHSVATTPVANDLCGRASLLRAWDLLFEDPDHSAALVLVSAGAYWPSWLGPELAGKHTFMVVVQGAMERDQDFFGRVEKRVNAFATTVYDIVWLRTEQHADTTWVLKLVDAIQDFIAPDYRVRLTNGRESTSDGLAVPHDLASGVSAGKSPRRRLSTRSVFPR